MREETLAPSAWHAVGLEGEQLAPRALPACGDSSNSLHSESGARAWLLGGCTHLPHMCAARVCGHARALIMRIGLVVHRSLLGNACTQARARSCLPPHPSLTGGLSPWAFSPFLRTAQRAGMHRAAPCATSSCMRCAFVSVSSTPAHDARQCVCCTPACHAIQHVLRACPCQPPSLYLMASEPSEALPPHLRPSE